MNPPSNKSDIEIPESLSHQLADFRRHLWRIKALEACAAGLIGLLLSFLLVFGLERLLPTPGWLRLLLLAGGVSLFALFAPYWLHRWVWKQRRDSQLARLIAKRYPGLGDRLLGVIELQGQSESEDSLSPRLREAAIAAVAAETGRRNLDDALPPRRHRRWGLAAILLATGTTAIFLLAPRASLNSLQRWLMPLSDTERYTFTRLAKPPAYLAVPFGEAFDVTLQLAKDTEQRPAQGIARYGSQPAITSSLNGESYQFTFPGQQDPGTVVFRLGDLNHRTRIEPVQRPSAQAVRATVVPPAYLGIANRTVELNAGAVSVVEGARLQIELEMNRQLARGNFGPSRGLPPIGGPDEPPSADLAPVEGELSVSGNTAKTAWIEVGSSPFELPLDWQDTLGIDGQPGFKLRVDALRDSPPTCYLQGIERQWVMLPEETIDFEVLAEDDFGLNLAGIEWTGQFTRPTDEPPANGEIQLAEGGPEQRRILANALFSPSVFGISPQKITLRGYTQDRYPQRARTYSEPVTIFVLTRDEHAQLLKNRFDRQITELEDLARRELGLLEENERLEKLNGEELQSEEIRQRLAEQERLEIEGANRMESLKQEMEDLMKDAARNGDIDPKTMQRMAGALKSIQELAEKDMPEIGEKLADAQEQSNTPEKTKEDTSEAAEKQRAVVEKMRETAQNANDANRMLEAGTFVNRLKKAASEQLAIVSSLREAFSRMLGLKTPALDPSEMRRLNENTAQQIQTAGDVRWIQEDLAHFHARTNDESFKAILEEMRDSGIDSGLDQVRQRLAVNHSFEAAEAARKWGDQLNEWASKLDGKHDDANGGGGGGGAPNPEDEDFEFMLRVMKLIQQEQDLRARTRALEQFRRDAAADQAVPNPH